MSSLRKWARLWIFLLLLAAVWIGGCTCAGSLRPLESDEPPTFAPDLTGKWVSTENGSEEKEYFFVEGAGDYTYRVRNLKEDEMLENVYELSLVQVGSYTFFDVGFKEVKNDRESKDATALGVLPIHFIGRIWMDGGTLRLGLLDFDWMKKMTSSGQLKLPYVEHHEGDEHLIFLTAESDQLREFVRQYAEDPEAFSMVSTFTRVSTAVEAPAHPKP